MVLPVSLMLLLGLLIIGLFAAVVITAIVMDMREEQEKRRK